MNPQKRNLFIEVNELSSENTNFHWHGCSNRLKKSRLIVNQILAQASHDFERHQFNTVVSGCMKLFNELSSYSIESNHNSDKSPIRKTRLVFFISPK